MAVARMEAIRIWRRVFILSLLVNIVGWVGVLAGAALGEFIPGPDAC